MGRGRGGEAVILHPQAWEGLGNPAVMVSPRPGYRLWVGLLSLGSSHPDLALSVLPPSPLCLALVLSPRRPRFCAPPPTLCLLSPLLCFPCVAGSLRVPPSLCCTPPPCAPCVSSLLRVSVSSFYHPCPSSSLPASSPPFASVSLPALPLPSHPWIPTVPFSLPSPDLHCPPPPLPGPTLLDTLPPVALEATSPR